MVLVSFEKEHCLGTRPLASLSLWWKGKGKMPVALAIVKSEELKAVPPSRLSSLSMVPFLFTATQSSSMD